MNGTNSPAVFSIAVLRRLTRARRDRYFTRGLFDSESRRFVDIGAADGVVASNCANLAFNLGFDSVFIERNGDYARTR